MNDAETKYHDHIWLTSLTKYGHDNSQLLAGETSFSLELCHEQIVHEFCLCRSTGIAHHNLLNRSTLLNDLGHFFGVVGKMS